MVVLGVILHALGGGASGSFYIPFKKVKGWAWESYWLVNGVMAWLIVPLIVGFMTVPHLVSILRDGDGRSLMWCYIFGMLWGIGGVTFGLSMRYLGMSLGYAISLGFCAAFGTILPPIYFGEFGGLLQTVSGVVTLSGVVVCLVGIGVCGWAGVNKERELTEVEKKETIKEFNFAKGVVVAIFAGVMSACMAFAIAAGKPIANLALERGVASHWQNSAVLVVVFWGGLTTNFIWCVFLNLKNRTGGDYFRKDKRRGANYAYSSMAGVIWYLQFMFYGMAMTMMGEYEFSSWTLHMAFIIVTSNVWGLIFREWKGASRKTIVIIVSGISIVFLSTIIIGIGNYLATV